MPDLHHEVPHFEQKRLVLLAVEAGLLQHTCDEPVALEVERQNVLQRRCGLLRRSTLLDGVVGEVLEKSLRMKTWMSAKRELMMTSMRWFTSAWALSFSLRPGCSS